jgi:hypothetical protein
MESPFNPTSTSLGLMRPFEHLLAILQTYGLYFCFFKLSSDQYPFTSYTGEELTDSLGSGSLNDLFSIIGRFMVLHVFNRN